MGLDSAKNNYLSVHSETLQSGGNKINIVDGKYMSYMLNRNTRVRSKGSQAQEAFNFAYQRYKAAFQIHLSGEWKSDVTNSVLYRHYLCAINLAVMLY